MDTDKLNTFLLFAETCNLSQTAERLHVTPPAVHKKLKVLEDELGVRLYERVDRRLRLTNAAEMLLPHMRSLKAQFEATLAAVNEWKNVKRGLVRLGTGFTFGTHVLPPFLESFQEHHEGVELRVHMGGSIEVAGELSNGNLDVAFISALDVIDTADFDIAGKWTFDVPAVANRRHVFSKGCSLSELGEQPFILYAEGALLDLLISEYFAAHSFRPRVVMRLNSPEMVEAMVRSDLGMSMLPAWMLGTDSSGPGVQEVPLREPHLEAQLYLVTRKISFLEASVRTFVSRALDWNWGSALRPASGNGTSQAY